MKIRKFYLPKKHFSGSTSKKIHPVQSILYLFTMNKSWKKKKNNPALLLSSWGFRRRTCLTSLLRIYLSHSGEFFHLMLGCRLISFSVNICAISDFKWKGGLVPEIKFTGRKSVHLSRLLEKSTLSSDYSCNAFRKL